MKTELLMGLVLLAGLPAIQDDGQDTRPLGGLDEAAPPASEAAETAGTRTPEAWRRALAADDLEARLEAYGELLDRAREDAETRELLEEWAGQQGELGWTARLALRELQLRGQAGRPADHGQGRPDPFGRGRGLGRPDPFGQGDPFAGGPFGWTPFGPFGSDPFGGTSDLLRDMEEQLGALLQGGSFGGHAFGTHGLGPGVSIEGQSQSLRMESGPEGVRVEVQEQDEDGNTHKQTYEAETLDELLELHPELRGRLQAGGSPGAGWSSGVRDLFDRLRERRGAAPFGSVAVPTDKLGILMREPGSFSSSVPGLDEDTGLLVERVLPGTLAAELGIRPGDVLTHLDGRALSSAEDVQAALSARRAGDRLTADVVDARGERRALSWRPPETEATGSPMSIGATDPRQL